MGERVTLKVPVTQPTLDNDEKVAGGGKDGVYRTQLIKNVKVVNQEGDEYFREETLLGVEPVPQYEEFGIAMVDQSVVMALPNDGPSCRIEVTPEGQFRVFDLSSDKESIVVELKSACMALDFDRAAGQWVVMPCGTPDNYSTLHKLDEGVPTEEGRSTKLRYLFAKTEQGQAGVYFLHPHVVEYGGRRTEPASYEQVPHANVKSYAMSPEDLALTGAVSSGPRRNSAQRRDRFSRPERGRTPESLEDQVRGLLTAVQDAQSVRDMSIAEGRPVYLIKDDKDKKIIRIRDLTLGEVRVLFGVYESGGGLVTGRGGFSAGGVGMDTRLELLTPKGGAAGIPGTAKGTVRDHASHGLVRVSMGSEVFDVEYNSARITDSDGNGRDQDERSHGYEMELTADENSLSKMLAIARKAVRQSVSGYG